MALVYSVLYWVWMLLWAVGLCKMIRVDENQTERQRFWKQSLIFIGINLLLFVPTALLVARTEIFYEVRDWLDSVLPWSQCAQTPWDQRVHNRAATVLLSTSSWLYQWLFISLWMVSNRYQDRLKPPVQKLQSRLRRRSILLGAGVATVAGGLFAIWLLWHGFRCGWESA